MTSQAEHWDGIYGRKQPTEVSWFREHLEQSLAFIDQAGLPPHAALIDVGGGASTLVDDLLARDATQVTVLDLSAKAIAAAQQRLGPAAARVQWLVGDVTTLPLPPRAFDFWHDRAVFHFLREPAERERYVAAVRRAVKPGGHVLVATFGPEGPERCSGLEVMRYSADALHAAFGDDFRRERSLSEVHRTPWGAEQQFVYCACRLR